MRPLHIGLTGNIASGKSTVVSMLAARGATVIDADLLAREAVAPGTPGFNAVLERFGHGIVAVDGSIDRAALRQRVFHDSMERYALNAIVHPAVGRLRDQQFAGASARGDAIVISDIPLLFEVGLDHAFDGIVFVDAPDAVRRARLMADRGLSALDADAMMAAQWSSDRKRPGARWVIDNDGTRAQLEARVDSVWHAILALSDQRRRSASVS